MKWINVKDRLPDNHPDDAENVLVVFAKFGERYPYVMIAWYDTRSKKWQTEDNDNIENNADYYWVIHWMPIPELPIK